MTVREFRALHRPGQPLVLPNAWDHASAAALVRAGFRAVGTTSLGVAAAHGLPDGQGVAGAQTLALAQGLAHLPCRLTVDIEAGFSADPVDVGQLAADLAAAGAVGINLEDGRPDGSLAPVDVQVELIRAVKHRAPELFVNARTDTYWLRDATPGNRPGGPDLTATLERLDAYVAAGADGVFVPGLADGGEIRTVVGRTAAPVNILFLSQHHTVPMLAEWGVSRISTGSLLFRAALHAAVATALAVARAQPVLDGIPTYAETNELGTREP
jgi:2-methylisocitrate lyase-like PEP mutase family enzyme